MHNNLDTVKFGYDDSALNNKFTFVIPKWSRYYINVHGYNELLVIKNRFPWSQYGVSLNILWSSTFIIDLFWDEFLILENSLIKVNM